MVWYGMVNVDLYSAIITKVSNALDTLVSGEKVWNGLPSDVTSASSLSVFKNSKYAPHRPNYCSWLAVCVNYCGIGIFTAKSH